MAFLQKLLVPIDGSLASLAALNHAIALALDNGAKVDALYVEAPDRFEVGSNAPAAPSARRESQAAMDAALQVAERQLGDRLSRLVVAGDPLRKIIEIAALGHYQMIVMGTHGRIGRLRSMFGSVAEGVVRNAPCPVLTVREPGGEYESFAERIHGTPSLADQQEPQH